MNWKCAYTCRKNCKYCSFRSSVQIILFYRANDCCWFFIAVKNYNSNDDKIAVERSWQKTEQNRATDNNNNYNKINTHFSEKREKNKQITLTFPLRTRRFKTFSTEYSSSAASFVFDIFIQFFLFSFFLFFTFKLLLRLLLLLRWPKRVRNVLCLHSDDNDDVDDNEIEN